MQSLVASRVLADDGVLRLRVRLADRYPIMNQAAISRFLKAPGQADRLDCRNPRKTIQIATQAGSERLFQFLEDINSIILVFQFHRHVG